MGGWFNGIVVRAVDLGLFITLVLLGHMALPDGMIGAVLWGLAVLLDAKRIGL